MIVPIFKKIIKDKISKNYIYLGKYYMDTENFIPAINAFNDDCSVYRFNKRLDPSIKITRDSRVSNRLKSFTSDFVKFTLNKD